MHPFRCAAVLALLLAGSLFAAPGASAEGVPTGTWPMCGTAPDTDGMWCVVSESVNGVATTSQPTGSGTVKWVQVYALEGSSHAFGYSAVQSNLDTGTQGPDPTPGDVVVATVNTGTWIPRGSYGRGGPLAIVRGGDATAGYTVTITATTAGVAWRNDFATCLVGACGDETTRADLEYTGWANGIVEDFGTYPEEFPGQRAMMAGFTQSSTAQDITEPHYDADTGAITVQLANPHLRSDGALVHGVYDAFVPTAMLTSVMGVPDPSLLSGGSLEVSRRADGTTTIVPVTVTHESGGIRIAIADVTFSSPTYRIRVKRTRPGHVRVLRATRASSTSALVRFSAPTFTGGSRITGYLARCIAPKRLARSTVGTRTALVVRGLRPGVVYACTVRARNVLGLGIPSRRWMVAARP